METNLCKVCGNSESLRYITVKERMLGIFDEFIYFQCPECNCLQIKNIPDDITQYYPQNYYSYKSLEKLINSPIRKWADTHRVKHQVYNKSLPGFFLSHLLKPLEYINWLKNTNVKPHSKILDVGCGQGRLLLRLALGGYTQLTGIDPFIKASTTYSNNVRLIKTTLEDYATTNRQFELIMLHHSLEHMPDQRSILCAINKLLSPTGVVLIRIPLTDSFAWQHYKEHWVQLDAPRHFYLHSKKSFSLAARESELTIEKIIYDSSKFQFTGSELYLRDIALNTSKKTRKIFTKKQLLEYDCRAQELNRLEQGDQAEFYLKKACANNAGI